MHRPLNMRRVPRIVVVYSSPTCPRPRTRRTSILISSNSAALPVSGMRPQENESELSTATFGPPVHVCKQGPPAPQNGAATTCSRPSAGYSSSRSSNRAWYLRQGRQNANSAGNVFTRFSVSGSCVTTFGCNLWKVIVDCHPTVWHSQEFQRPFLQKQNAVSCLNRPVLHS
jgi:hypothetical protein